MLVSVQWHGLVDGVYDMLFGAGDPVSVHVYGPCCIPFVHGKGHGSIKGYSACELYIPLTGRHGSCLYIVCDMQMFNVTLPVFLERQYEIYFVCGSLCISVVCKG
jgi:hypothetical protein